MTYRKPNRISETKLEMAERHVRQGAKRVYRQKVLIETLVRDGHVRMLFHAQELLVEFEAMQAMSEDYLARFRAEAAKDRS